MRFWILALILLCACNVSTIQTSSAPPTLPTPTAVPTPPFVEGACTLTVEVPAIAGYDVPNPPTDQPPPHQIAGGDTLTVIGQSADGVWIQARYTDGPIWLRGEFLLLSGDCNALPVTG